MGNRCAYPTSADGLAFRRRHLGGRDAQLLSAADLRSGSGPREADAAGGLRRLRPDRHRRDGAGVPARFGLDQPLWRQYLTYLGDVARLDFGYSIANYPRTVVSIMGDALPWTIGLLLTTTVLGFVIGTLAGALLAWPRSPGFIQYLFPPLLTLSAIPFFLLGLV